MIFTPTATSKFLCQSIIKNKFALGDCLDLGCGAGYVGVELLKHKALSRLFSSDVSYPAVKECEANAIAENMVIDVRVGSLFEPWLGFSFDSIVNDVSGLSAEVAPFSKWFKNGVPYCHSKDGNVLVKESIAQSTRYLKKGGVLIFPAISLSNWKETIEFSRKFYKTVEVLDTFYWPLGDDIDLPLIKLRDIKERGAIDFEEKFGQVICFTKIVICKDPV